MYIIKAINRETGNTLVTQYANTEAERNNKIAFLDEHYGHDCEITSDTK